VTRLRRLRSYIRPVSFLAIGLFILVGPIGAGFWLILHWPNNAPDQIALSGVVATVAAAWLAFVAAVVALLAYMLADESPDVTLLLDGKPLADGLDLYLTSGPEGRYVINAPQVLTFRLVNKSGFSARNPSISVSFTGVWLHGFSPEWKVYFQSAEDITLHWSGGADFSVHGHWEENAPSLGLFGNGSWARETVTMKVEVVAEGFWLPEQSIPIRVHR